MLKDEIIVTDRSSPEFLTKARILGDYIKALPLTVEQNDTLIRLIADNMNESDKGAFLKGMWYAREVL